MTVTALDVALKSIQPMFSPHAYLFEVFIVPEVVETKAVGIYEKNTATKKTKKDKTESFRLLAEYRERERES